MKQWRIGVVLVLLVGVVAGCGGGDSSSSGEVSVADDNPVSEEQGTVVKTGSQSEESDAEAAPGVEEEVPLGNRLVMGTLMLEGTENAVTPEQAKKLLPLWQAIQGGSLQGEAESDAVLKQIEAAMTAEQMAAIDDMPLSSEELRSWMEKQGINFRPPPGGEGGKGGVGPGAFADMTEEERAEMRATRQAGGGGFGPGGGFADMSEEEREAMRATAEASGFAPRARPGGGAGGGQGQLTFLAVPLVELLTGRAAE